MGTQTKKPWEKYQSQQAQSGPWDKYKQAPAADPLDAIRAQQAKQFPTSAEMGGKPGAAVYPGQKDYSPLEERIARAGKAGLRMVTGIPEMLMHPIESVAEPSRQAFAKSEDPSRSVPERIAHGATGLVPVIGPAIGDMAERATSGQMPEVIGETAAGVLGAKGAGALKHTSPRGIANAVTSPDSLMTRAANNRAAAGARPPGIGIPTTQTGAAVAAIRTAVSPALKATANIQERISRWMAEGDTTPAFQQRPPVQRNDLTFNPPEETAPTFAERPPVQRQDLPFREPVETYQYRETPAKVRGEDLPFTEPTETFQYAERPPVQRGPDLPFTEPEIVTAPQPPRLDTVKAAIRPLGNKAKASTVTNVPKLVEVAPELVSGGLTYETFGPRAIKALERVGKDVEAAENAVPRTVTVPKKPIVDGLALLAEEFKTRGIPKAEAAVDAVGKQWASLPDEIPWEQFVQMKRGFFQGVNVNSAPMQAAYRHLMEASSKVSEQLATANRAYSVVRKAITDAGVHVRTGERIRDVGRPQTAPTFPRVPPAAPVIGVNAPSRLFNQ